jgi:DNA polymerase beta
MTHIDSQKRVNIMDIREDSHKVPSDYKPCIIRLLQNHITQEQAARQPFKVRAYRKVLEHIQAHSGAISSFDDIKAIPGMGQSIQQKIIDVFSTPCSIETATKNESDRTRAIQDLMRVHAIGAVKAAELVDTHTITTVEQLKARSDLLNEKQKMGLKYVTDIEIRIPRKEMVKHEEYIIETIRAIDPSICATLTGSFRRNATSSGDIDVLITHPSMNSITPIVDAMIAHGYITDCFANGPKKCLAVCRLKRFKTFRRIDLLFTPPSEYAFALLYFTGCGAFNIKMRNHALARGFSLSEHGLKPLDANSKANAHVMCDPTEFTSEQDIFTFLGLQYVPPDKRTETLELQMI